jgi:hypothetical protein
MTTFSVYLLAIFLSLPTLADHSVHTCEDLLLVPNQNIVEDVVWRHSLERQSFDLFIEWFRDQEPKVQNSVWWTPRALDQGARLQSLPKLVSTTETGVWEIKPQGRTTSRVFVGVGRGGFRILFGSPQVKAHPSEQNRQILRAAKIWRQHLASIE